MLFHIQILQMDWKVTSNLNFLFRVLTVTIGQTNILLKRFHSIKDKLLRRAERIFFSKTKMSRLCLLPFLKIPLRNLDLKVIFFGHN